MAMPSYPKPDNRMTMCSTLTKVSHVSTIMWLILCIGHQQLILESVSVSHFFIIFSALDADAWLYNLAFCYGDVPDVPTNARREDRQAKQYHTVGQEIIFKCFTGYEFKTAVPTGSQGTVLSFLDWIRN